MSSNLLKHIDITKLLYRAGIGLWELHLQPHKTFTFDTFGRQLLNFSEDALSYEDLLNLVSEPDRARFDAAFIKVSKQDSQKTIDIAVKITTGGIIKTIQFFGEINDAADRISGILTDTTRYTLDEEERQKLKILVENSPDFMGISGNNGTIEHVNRIGRALLGIDEAIELNTISPADFYPETELGRMQEVYKELNDKGSWKGTIFLKHFKTGESIPGLASFELVMNPVSGEILGRSVTVRDLRPELKAQKALSENETMFRHVTQNAPTGLWMSDAEGGLIYLNKTLVDWTGMAYDDLLGFGWANAVIEEDRQKSGEVFLAAVNGRTHYDVEFRINKSDGTVCWCRAAGDPYYDDNGVYAGYAGFCMDIHQRVEMSEVIQESEQRIRNIIDQAPIAIGVLRGKELIVESGNQIILKVWGKDASIIGKPILEALPEIKGQGFMELLEGVYTTGVPFHGNSILAQLEHHGNIEDIYFDFVYTPVRDSKQEINGVMVVASDVTRQVLAKKEVEESEAKFRALIEEAPVPTAVLFGRELIIETANEPMLKLWGKGGGVMGMRLDKALPELEGQPFLQIFADIFDTGVAYESQEARAELVVDGKLTTFYFNFTYKPLFNSKGEVYAVIDMAIDVTEQVLARKAIEESELFSRTILYNSPIAKMVVTGKDMIIKRVNEKMLDMLGRDETIIEKPFMQVMPELLKTPLMERLTHVFVSGETYYRPDEKIELLRFGKPYTGYYNYIYKALRTVEGDIYGIMITASEVTEEVMARKKIEEAETSLRGAIELANLGTWSINLATGILEYDERLRDWFGFTKQEVITIERAYSPISEDDRPLVKAAILHAVTEGTDGIYNVEYRVKNLKAGFERILHAQGKTYFNEDAIAYKISGTVQDVTNERKVELELTKLVQQRTEELAASNEELQALNEEITVTNEELEEANQHLYRSNEELSQYAYVASHDLQEPLRKIRVFSGILRGQQTLSEENRILVDKIDKSSERMTLLIKDLLEFSKLLKSDLMLRPVNLNDIVKEVIVDFELILQEKHAEISVQDLPVIEAVSLQMNQLFYNIISNGLKFMDPAKEARIVIGSRIVPLAELSRYVHKVKPGTEYYDISFEDNGIGFEEKYAEQIFEVFKRLHGKDVFPGSGIGLALCRRIVNNHGGAIYAESRQGIGTTFHVILPQSAVRGR